MMTIQEFCDRHGACDDGRDWAVANCRDMNHAWETLRPDWLVWAATRPGVLDDRTLRLFAVWSARQVQHLLTDPRSLAALDVAERHADGQATDDELSSARAAAWAAARAAAWSAAEDAARAAARDAARAPAWAAASDAAWAAARDAARAPAWAAAWAGARDAAWSPASDAAWAAAREAASVAAWIAARDAQAAWLRANATPCFDGGGPRDGHRSGESQDNRKETHGPHRTHHGPAGHSHLRRNHLGVDGDPHRGLQAPHPAAGG